MEVLKDKKFIIITLIFATLFLVLLSTYFLISSNKPVVETDAQKFKYEYEKLNGIIREKDDHIMDSLDIAEDNPMKYITYEDMNSFMKPDNKKHIIYIGTTDCPWCRTAVPVLLEAAKDANIKEISYLNIGDESLADTEERIALRDSIMMSMYNNSVYEQPEEGASYGWRLPTILFIDNGEIKDFRISTIPSQTRDNKYIKLTEEEHDLLYNDYITKMNDLLK